MTGATAGLAGTSGSVPAPAAGQQASFLRGDGTWQVVSAATMTGATGVLAGTAGSVPAPAATDNVKYLRGGGTWAAVAGGVPVYAAFTVTANAVSGKVQLSAFGCTAAQLLTTTVTPSANGDTVTVSGLPAGAILARCKCVTPAGFNTNTQFNFSFPEPFAPAGTIDDILFPTIIHWNSAGVIQSRVTTDVTTSAGVTNIRKTGLVASVAAIWSISFN
jgi:hypothetical protein